MIFIKPKKSDLKPVSEWVDPHGFQELKAMRKSWGMFDKIEQYINAEFGPPLRFGGGCNRSGKWKYNQAHAYWSKVCTNDLHKT